MMKEDTLYNSMSASTIKKVDITHPKQVYGLHDHAFKACLKDIVVAQDFFEIHIPEHIKKDCKFSTLAISNTEYAEPNSKKGLSDVLYCVDKKGGNSLYLLIEHVSKAKASVAIQVLRYQTSIFSQHLSQLSKKKRSNNVLPYVLPIIFYRSENTAYAFSTNVADCFGSREETYGLCSWEMLLVDLSVIPDDVLKTHKSIALLELLQKHAPIGKPSNKWVEQLKGWLIEDRLHQQIPTTCLPHVITYIYSISPPEAIREVTEIIKQTDTELEHVMQTMTQSLRQEGIQLGLQKGKFEERHTIARNMILEGDPVKKIAKMTGLKQKDIQKLSEEFL